MFNKTLCTPELGLHFLSYKKIALAVTCSVLSKYSNSHCKSIGLSELDLNPEQFLIG